MIRILPAFLLLLLLQSPAFAQHFSRSNNKASNPYRGQYQRMGNGSTVVALDMQGRVITTTVISATTKLDVQNRPAGIYTVKFEDGSVVKLIKQ